MTSTQKICLTLYFVLLFLCVTMFVASNFFSFEARTAAISLASDGFKLVLGAIVGTLSAMIGVTAKTPE